MGDLLHLQNVPNQMLSGVSGEALEFINRESSDRYLLELDINFLSNLNDLCNELPRLTKEQLEELDNIEQSSIPIYKRWSWKGILLHSVEHDSQKC